MILVFSASSDPEPQSNMGTKCFSTNYELIDSNGIAVTLSLEREYEDTPASFTLNTFGFIECGVDGNDGCYDPNGNYISVSDMKRIIISGNDFIRRDHLEYDAVYKTGSC